MLSKCLSKVLSLQCFFLLLFASFFSISLCFAAPPTFDVDIAAPLVAGGENSAVYSSFDGLINSNQSLLQNLKNIFYPPVFGDEQTSGGKIWELIRISGVGILVVMLIWGGFLFVSAPTDPEQRQQALMNLVYIMYGTVLFFGVTWVLGTLLDIGSLNGLIEGEDSVLERGENSLVLQVIGFLKAFAYFLAIVFIAWYGYSMMLAQDSDEKIKAARQGIFNVILALILIKVIDFVYYVVQTSDIQGSATGIIASTVTFLSWIFGFLLFFVILYIGFLYITSAGNEERISSAKKLLRNVFLIMLIVFLFLLIVYQIFADISL